jgi:hypothetical protein
MGNSIICLLFTLNTAIGGIFLGDSLRIDGAVIPYKSPAGYVKMQKDVYGMYLEYIRMSMESEGMVLHEAYLPRVIDYRNTRSRNHLIFNHLLVVSPDFEYAYDLSENFASLKKNILGDKGAFVSGEQALSKILGDMKRDLRKGSAGTDIVPLGAYSNTENEISVLILEGTTDGGTQDAVIGITAVATTYMLIENRIVGIHQHWDVDSAAEVLAFLDRAREVFDSMDFSYSPDLGAK